MTVRCRSRAVVAAAAAAADAPHVIWMRAGDLRTHDHPALAAAAANATPVLPVFVFDPSEGAHCTPAMLRMLHESVAELRATLRGMGSDLAIRVGSPAEELPRLAAAVGAGSVAVQAELEW